MAEKIKNPSRAALDRLQKRLKQDRKPPKTEDQNTIVNYLIRNLDSQRQLAEWQDLLRNEQFVLLTQMWEKRIHQKQKKK